MRQGGSRIRGKGNHWSKGGSSKRKKGWGNMKKIKLRYIEKSQGTYINKFKHK